jgi:hypothetical protein
MDINTFRRRLSHSPVPLFAIMLLIALACSIPVFCGEIHDAAQQGDLAKVQALQKQHGFDPGITFKNQEPISPPLKREGESNGRLSEQL